MRLGDLTKAQIRLRKVCRPWHGSLAAAAVRTTVLTAPASYSRSVRTIVPRSERQPILRHVGREDYRERGERGLPDIELAGEHV
jgi:hypothetical protein